MTYGTDPLLYDTLLCSLAVHNSELFHYSVIVGTPPALCDIWHCSSDVENSELLTTADVSHCSAADGHNCY